MKAHVQNPWTRSPSLMVNMTVEEVQQTHAALTVLVGSIAWETLDANARDATNQLLRTLHHALATALPQGIRGVMP